MIPEAITDPTALEILLKPYPVAYIMLILSLFGFSVPIVIYRPQIKHLMNIITTQFKQIETINNKRDIK